MMSSSDGSFSPAASRMAAADLLGRTAGETVKRLSKDDAGSTWLWEVGSEVRMEVMAWDVDVRERACVISCFSFACVQGL